MWLNQDPKREDSWNCDDCIAKGNDTARGCDEEPQAICEEHGNFLYNALGYKDDTGTPFCPVCGGKVRWKFKPLFLGTTYAVYSCPVQQLEPYHMFLVKLVFWSESSGVMPVTGGLLEQSNFYFEVRNVIMAERAIAEEEMKPKETKPKDQQQSIQSRSLRAMVRSPRMRRR